MHMSTARLRAVIVATALIAVVGGCGSRPGPPEPTDDSGSRYEQIPEDLCDRVRVEEVAERFDLSIAPWYEPSSNYSTEPTHWYERCGFSGQDKDGRYATELEDFRPTGAVVIRVYHETTDAEESYEQRARNAFEHRADTQPGATVADTTGWWDSGVSLEWVREVDSEDHIGDATLSNLVVSYLVRHGNLVVEGHLDAVSLAENQTDVLAFLYDLQRALIDETVEHLAHTAE